MRPFKNASKQEIILKKERLREAESTWQGRHNKPAFAIVPQLSEAACWLHSAIKRQDPAEVNKALWSVDINVLCETGREGRTAMQEAMELGNIQIVNIIKKHIKLEREGECHV